MAAKCPSCKRSLCRGNPRTASVSRRAITLRLDHGSGIRTVFTHEYGPNGDTRPYLRGIPACYVPNRANYAVRVGLVPIALHWYLCDGTVLRHVS